MEWEIASRIVLGDGSAVIFVGRTKEPAIKQLAISQYIIPTISLPKIIDRLLFSTFNSNWHHTTGTANMVIQASQTSSRTSSVTAPVERAQATNHHALGTTSLWSALKKPFQGWSKELLRARDHDDDDYNFANGARRGAQFYREGK
ncbi:hypothetical protein N0V83_003604 [Neocucurbitaria cava]|uniref:Uncharacterized protein n=1 Tax=Neocucurbitaria cava TaxID=798079 RepID=A0A9W8YBP9_9PLEO|nr:hypothetical protein N0V83_003604 [Neocucurbitaria cava]